MLLEVTRYISSMLNERQLIWMSLCVCVCVCVCVCMCVCVCVCVQVLVIKDNM